MNNNISKEELTILFKEELAKSDIIKTLKSVDNYAVINKLDNMGVKRLAYKVDGREKARYIELELAVDKRDIPKISNTLSLDNNVIRYLVININGEKRLKVLSDWKM